MQIIVINKKIKKIVESACKHMLECSSKKTHLIEEDTQLALQAQNRLYKLISRQMALFQIQQANNKLKITFGTPGCQSYYNQAKYLYGKVS